LRALKNYGLRQARATDRYTCDALRRAAAAYEEEMVWRKPYNVEEQKKAA
jgi:hypothetical protein